MRLSITIDTREQTPWTFPEELAETVRGTLVAGDYALRGDTAFAIERKSLDDFMGTISSGWDRFQRELQRMEVLLFQARVVVVEGSIHDLFEGEHRHGGLSFKFALKRIAELTMQGVTVLMADTPVHGAALAYTILKQRHKQLYGNNHSHGPTSKTWASLEIPEAGQQVDGSPGTPRRINAKRNRQRRARGGAPERRAAGTARRLEAERL